MKLETKKISLISATAIWVFSGIFGLAEAVAQEATNERFDRIEIINNLKYDVEVTINKVTTDLNYKGESDLIPFDVTAGEHKEEDQQSDLSLRRISISPKNPNLIVFGGSGFLHNHGQVKLFRGTVIEGLEVVGDFSIVALVDDEKTLNIKIDSKDEDLQYDSGEELCEAKAADEADEDEADEAEDSN